MRPGLDRLVGSASPRAAPLLGPAAGRVAGGIGDAVGSAGLAGLDVAAARFGALAETVGRSLEARGVAAYGASSLPEVGDGVLVAFEPGDLRGPVVVGGPWNGSDAPPTSASDGKDVSGWWDRAASLAERDPDGTGGPGRALRKVRAMAQTVDAFRDLQREVAIRKRESDRS